MNVINPLGKIVEIVPERGGLVLRGRLIALTERNAIIISDDNVETVTCMVSNNMRIADSQVVEDVAVMLDFSISEERIRAVIAAYNTVTARN